MVQDKDLDELGFSPFEHLSKNKRDGEKRMSWCGVLDDYLLSITIVRTVNTWEIELMKIDSDEVMKKYFSLNPNISEVLQVLKAYSHLDGPGD